MPQSPFTSIDHFRLSFSSGLGRLLQNPAIGTYILAHANAGFDPELFGILRPGLRKAFDHLLCELREQAGAERKAAAGGEDAAVFRKLTQIGFEGIQQTRFRSLDEWELQFNPLRAFRPSRMTAERVSGIHRAFDPSGFHFNKPFLRQEAIWAGELLGEPVELLYNKYPFVSLHGLLVPDREAQHPQLLSHRYHDYVWRLCEALGETLPGWGVGYNSYGAYASVNHLHFQTFVRETPLPVTREVWQHRGGERAYPLDCEVYEAMDEAWQRIESLHAEACSYNLIYLPGRLYCLPRSAQGAYAGASWSSGFAWYEVAGGFTTSSLEAFEGLDEATIMRELARLALSTGDQYQSSQSSR
ncbi:MAG: hypothetical protein P8103_13970 [Candidatus Thiodiazotropha sp.]